MTAAAVQSPNTPPALPGVLGVTSAVPQGRKKDVTAALRARRHRARKKANQINASVTVSSDGAKPARAGQARQQVCYPPSSKCLCAVASARILAAKSPYSQDHLHRCAHARRRLGRV
jgi:hypothetical protein